MPNTARTEPSAVPLLFSPPRDNPNLGISCRAAGDSLLAAMLAAAAALGVRGGPESSGSVPFRPVLSTGPRTLAPEPIVPLAIRLPASAAVNEQDEVVSLAERYDSADCRNAIDKEAAWDHLCGGKRASHNPLCLRMQQKYLKMKTSSPDHRFREVLYVRNQKAASQLWVREFSNMLGIKGPFPGLHRATNLKVPNGTFVFSFVREPLQTALDGYLELRDQARFDPFLRDSLAAILGQPPSIDPNQCSSTTQATNEFVAFVGALRRRAPLGDGAWHTFPQAIKLGHVDNSTRGRRFNALGKVEHLLNDTNAIRALVGTPGQLSWQQLSSQAFQSRRHTLSNTTCAQIDRDDATLQRLVCEVYAADYTCFGYKRPDHCAKSEAEKAEARHTPTQFVLEPSPSPVSAAANALLQVQAPSNTAPTDANLREARLVLTMEQL